MSEKLERNPCPSCGSPYHFIHGGLTNCEWPGRLQSEIKELEKANAAQAQEIAALKEEIQSHHEEFEQLCGYKKLIDAKGEIAALKASIEARTLDAKEFIARVNEKIAAKDAQIAELQSALSGRTVSCGHCSALADRNVVLVNERDEAKVQVAEQGRRIVNLVNLLMCFHSSPCPSFQHCILEGYFV